VRAHVGFTISSSLAVAAAIAAACSSFEASEGAKGNDSDADAPPVDDGGSDVVSPTVDRWCAGQDATFCDDFDDVDEPDASVFPRWTEVEVARAHALLERNDLTWRSSPFSLLAEATWTGDAGGLAGRVVKIVPATNAIEVAFDLYVEHVKHAGEAGAEDLRTEDYATPLLVSCEGNSVINYRLTVRVLRASRSDFQMRVETMATDERHVGLANRPALRSWRRVFVRLGVKEPMKPFVAVDDPSLDLVPPGDPFPIAKEPTACAVHLGANVGPQTSAAFRFDNVVIRTL